MIGAVPGMRDTLPTVFSAREGASALCAHVLADRGLLDLDASVTRCWLELGQSRQGRCSRRDEARAVGRVAASAHAD
jgi:CubicO group peptidase (beta-lactamase class C family)